VLFFLIGCGRVVLVRPKTAEMTFLLISDPLLIVDSMVVVPLKFIFLFLVTG